MNGRPDWAEPQDPGGHQRSPVPRRPRWWSTALLALVCFGPPLAFFGWIAWDRAVHYADDTGARVPFTAAAGMAIILLLSRYIDRNPNLPKHKIIARLLVLSALAIAMVALVWLIIDSLGWWAILSLVGVVGSASAVWYYAQKASRGSHP